MKGFMLVTFLFLSLVVVSCSNSSDGGDATKTSSFTLRGDDQ